MHITDFNTYCEFCLNALASSHFAFLPFVVLLYLLLAFSLFVLLTRVTLRSH